MGFSRTLFNGDPVRSPSSPFIKEPVRVYFSVGRDIQDVSSNLSLIRMKHAITLLRPVQIVSVKNAQSLSSIDS